MPAATTNPYLDTLQAKYDGLKDGMQGLIDKAQGENRDLSPEELELVRSQAEESKSLFTQIEQLTEIESRHLKVAELAASLLTPKEGEGENTRSNGGAKTPTTRGKALGITAQERDPGHYRSVKEGGDNSFFADLYRARMGDEVAGQRLAEHQRALTTGTNGPGVVPPHWLTEEFEELARQGRALANAVRNIPLGDDPRPLTLPKQTAGTDAVVSEQTTEGAANPEWDDDAYDTDVDTVAPKPTAGKQIVSRQMLDMSNPAIDQLIYGDLIAVYNTKVEAKVCAAVKGVGTVLAGLTGGAGVEAQTTESEFADVATPANKDSGDQLALRAAIEVRKARKLPANILAMTIDRYGMFLGLKDSTGRPLMPDSTAGPMNVIGVGTVAVDGRIRELGVVATDGMGTGAYPDAFCALRASDVLLFESNILRFRFEEQAGPENIVLGIWGYTAALVRQGTKSVKRVEITA